MQIYQPQNAVNLSLLSLTPNWPLKLLNESQEKSSAKKKDFQSKQNEGDGLYFYIYIYLSMNCTTIWFPSMNS